MPELSAISALPDHTAAGALRFSIREGDIDNEFLRQGPVAAHLVLSSGSAARLIVAFPAGNSALGLWCEPGPLRCHWDPVANLHAVQGRDSAGRVLYGVRGQLALRGGALRLRQAVLSSARVVRDVHGGHPLPPALAAQQRHDGSGVHWWRDRLDGAPGYALSLTLDSGTVEADDSGALRLLPGGDGVLRLTVTALCGETPLTPMAPDALLRDPATGDARTRNSLAFLSYQEKLLAGSWRFNTYFGRDTLMSLALLMPALAPRAIEAAFGAVLSRLAPTGEVAHEEDIGECALLHPAAAQAGRAFDAPICDYKMVDDDFMLAPVMAAYLATRTPAEANALLANRTAAGRNYRALLLDNIGLVLAKATPFAQAPQQRNLIALKPGQITGDWRDSADGLGGGVYSYNVNAVLVPAALRAIAALAGGGLLDGAPPPPLLDQAAAMAQQWERYAPALFRVERSEAAARAAVATHAAELGLDPHAALDSLAPGPHSFYAIALDADGAPVPVLHSDFGFALLLQSPPPDVIEHELAALMRPFPAGLMTDVGLLVANGAFAPPAQRALFGPDRYHGAVVWSWQQALLAEGLARQRRRGDLPASTQAALAEAERTLWRAISATRAQGNSELWSWQYENGAGDPGQGRYTMQPFGPASATADESNAAQLWSTVYLAVLPPAEAV
jgi:hypothetical protein